MKINPDELPPIEWQPGCYAVLLHNTGKLQVKVETMSAGASEQLHLHENTEQVFYLLEGTATFFLEHLTFVLYPGNSISVKACTKHKIHNPGPHRNKFLVISGGPANADRVNCL